MPWMPCTVVQDLPQIHVFSRMQIIVERPSISPLWWQLLEARGTADMIGAVELPSLNRVSTYMSSTASHRARDTCSDGKMQVHHETIVDLHWQKSPADAAGYGHVVVLRVLSILAQRKFLFLRSNNRLHPAYGVLETAQHTRRRSRPCQAEKEFGGNQRRCRVFH